MMFGTADDVVGIGENPNSGSLFAKVMIGGQAQGNPLDLAQMFGVVANHVGGFKTAGANVPVTSGVDLRPIGSTGTFNLREVPA